MGWAARANGTARDAREGKVGPKPKPVRYAFYRERQFDAAWRKVVARGPKGKA